MKSTFLILIFAAITFQVDAYPSVHQKKATVKLLKSGNYSDLRELNELYRECHTTSEALQLMEELDDLIKTESSTSLNHLAAASRISALGDHSTALEQLNHMSSSLNRQSTFIRGEYYATIGSIAYRSENPTGAIEHTQKGIDLLKKTKEDEALQVAYIHLGLAHGAIGEHEKALVYYDEAEKATQYPSAKVKLYLQLNRALTYSNMKKHDLSKVAFHDALDIIKETKDYFAEVRTYGNLADIYIAEDSLEIAEDYLLQGRKLATEHGFKLDLIRFDLTLSQVYQSQGEFEKAFMYLQSHDSIRNSVHIEKAAQNVVELEKNNQKTIHTLKQQALQRTIQLENQKKWILWGGISLLSLICIFLLRQFVVIKRKNKVLLRKNLNENTQQLAAHVSKRDTSLSDEDLKLIEAFEELMIANRAFCKADLTQDKVARKLGTNRTYLSKAINDHYNMSYSKWLNELRISESKKMLVDEKFDHYSIEGVATTVGFSSLSTFNSNFKSITGLTPSYFRKNHTNN